MATYDQLNQNDEPLVPTPETSVSRTVATPMIEVVAPSNLPENYSFEARVGDKTFSVKVPPGGVEEGQKFSVPLPGGGDAVDTGMMTGRISVPVGHWRDGIFDCCLYGCFNPLFWNSIFCVPIATAQVMTRLKLNWLGKPGSVGETASTFRIVFTIVVIYFVVEQSINLFIFFSYVTGNLYEFDDELIYDDDEPVGYVDPDTSSYRSEARRKIALLNFFRKVFRLAYFVYACYALKTVRSHVREKYAIPETSGLPKGSEDICCSVFCQCCTVAQLARHTTDYETYRSVCCSDTGLPSHVPAIL